MKNIKTNSHCLFRKSGMMLLLALLILSGSSVMAAEKKKKKKKKRPVYSVSFKLAAIYDDNILKYSDQYLDRFIKGEDEGRFHIDTYDDVIFYTALQLSSSFYIFKKRKTVVNGEVSRRTYAVNKIKDWSYMAFGIRQYITKRLSFKFSYSYIPEFYVRHFRDRQWLLVYGYDPIVFQPYAFSKDNYGFWIQNTFFKSTRIKFSLYYAPYYHNEHYTEFDSKNWTYGAQLYQRLHKKIKIELGYQYITSDAKGFDASYQTPETTNGPDATYVEDRISMGFAWQLPKLKKMKNSFDAKIAFLNRYYSSKHPPLMDPLHTGRVDKNIRMYFNYKLKLNKAMQLRAYFNWYMRDTDTEAGINKEFISNEKDYRQNIIGLEFVYNLKI
ncbi:MAG: hypothetical protein GXO89_17005 [Chlorobi bacterium]|nr:hypothetical protein [Chlorobiota bacterium]